MIMKKQDAGANIISSVFAFTIATTIPGSHAVTTGPNGVAGIVANFYEFALLIGGIMALGAIVWGGVKYTWAAGNPSGQSEGKEWIKSALYGLLLLAGAYVILNTINPQLLNLGLPTLQEVTVPANTPGTGTGTGSTSTDCGTPGCVAPQVCKFLASTQKFQCVASASLNCNGQCGAIDPSCQGTCSNGNCLPHVTDFGTEYSCIAGNTNGSSGCYDSNFNPHCVAGSGCQGLTCSESACQNFTSATNTTCVGL